MYQANFGRLRNNRNEPFRVPLVEYAGAFQKELDLMVKSDMGQVHLPVECFQAVLDTILDELDMVFCCEGKSDFYVFADNSAFCTDMAQP